MTIITKTQFEFSFLGYLFLFSIFLSVLLLVVSFVVSTPKPNVEKLSAYECGFEPYEDARDVFDVHFYLVAILFIIFDLEAVYFFPWCAAFSSLTTNGYFFMLDFIVELLAGFLYAWRLGAFGADN
jgi:NADH:ubiquinone oxidoreductase subunit 3 (subunit A)